MFKQQLFSLSPHTSMTRSVSGLGSGITSGFSSTTGVTPSFDSESAAPSASSSGDPLIDVSVPCLPDPAVDRWKFVVVCGDAYHRLLTHRTLLNYGSIVDRFLTQTFKANYIRDYYPQLVPTPTDGVPRNDKKVSEIFCYQFETSASFRENYLVYLRGTARC